MGIFRFMFWGCPRFSKEPPTFLSILCRIEVGLFVNTECSTNTGSVILALGDDPGNYTFTWDTPNGLFTNSLNELSDLEVGEYFVTITDTRFPDCFVIDSLQVLDNCDDSCTGLVDIFSVNSEVLRVQDCENILKYCTDILITEVEDYTYSINGAALSQTTSCSYDSTYVYTYFSIPDAGAASPYELSSWTVNGVSFNAGFNTIPELVDLMNEFDSQGLWTLDDDQLIITGGSTANEYGNMEILQLSSGQIGILDANAKFVPFSVALDIEEGPNSIVVTQVETGCQDSILVFVECLEVNVTPDTIEVVIELGTDTLICFDPSELTAPIATVESYCEDVSTEIVNYDISNNCVNISAEFIGDDIGCFVYCDENDICDTLVIFSIVVTEGSIVPPVAMDDDTVTIVNWHIQNFDITQNDTFDISNDSLAIISEPHYGTVDLNFDFTINYIPDEDFCGEIDSFMYMIVSPHGTDIATVYIDILCEDITIFNGFSPNGDSVNESFVITGIESFENNRVVIFNRWGKQVYYKENYTYENGWDGTWEGNHLPDGTYFYLIDVGDNRQFSGYVQIHR